VRRLLASHIGSNPVAGEQMSRGELEVEFSPQGTLAERIRAGGMGLGGILVDVGLGTVAEQGKERFSLNDRDFLVEPALTAEVAVVFAAKADPLGNLVFDKTARNFNPLVAMAGDITIAEAAEVVPVGALDPECIVTPGIFVDMVVQSDGIHWTWVWEGEEGA
jgi:acetate CoA/acetoacetate CoA-transferase alpha subunit